MTGRLASVNVVHALIPDVLGSEDRTAIDKRAVEGRVAVSVPGYLRLAQREPGEWQSLKVAKSQRSIGRAPLRL